ncbi:MAG: Aminodeoxychorismate lyase [Candidatus Tokpelaia sp. JSC161]|jgi:UPF0755 protein|nr:MAG: Aminodeoxychorismate lyase [Candidatus Tokpelaia sp. JSC161]
MKFFNIFFVIFLLFVFLGAKHIFERDGPSEGARIICVKAGMGIHSIAGMLKRKGLINKRLFFICAVNCLGKAKEFKAGEYEIPAHASMQTIMEILMLGHSIEHRFTVPEGLTVSQVVDLLAQDVILIGPLPKQLPYEGWLLTDTIKFFRGTSRSEIIERLHERQIHLVKEIWKTRDPDLPLKDMNELVTLASIVEKETSLALERRHIASVFYNRLKKKMPLQSDSTVLYGVFYNKGKLPDRPIYRSDLDQRTAFNTYQISGLPPSAIANPGRAALQAVAHPMDTDDIYFVADGKGGHVFAKSLNEHNINVIKWRQFQKRRKRIHSCEET